MAVDIIQTLRDSDNKLLKAASVGIEKWMKLKHTKEDLELLLAYNIAEIEFMPENKRDFVKAVVTGNNRLINVYKKNKKEDKTKQLKSPFTGIKTRDKQSVLAYDLIEGKLKTIKLDRWRITNFMPITEDNILILDQLVNECIKR